MKRRKGYCNIDEECYQCDENIKPYGCTNHMCPIYYEWEQGKYDEAADFDHDERKESRIHPIFDEILKAFTGVE